MIFNSHFSVRVFDLYIRDNIPLFTEADYYMQGTLAACYLEESRGERDGGGK